jgi:hypothetical protein
VPVGAWRNLPPVPFVDFHPGLVALLLLLLLALIVAVGVAFLIGWAFRRGGTPLVHGRTRRTSRAPGSITPTWLGTPAFRAPDASSLGPGS